MPEYTHTWDLRDLNAILKGMHRKQTYVNKAQDMYDFATEYGDEIINDFLRLYIETMKKNTIGNRPRAGEKIFHEKPDGLPNGTFFVHLHATSKTLGNWLESPSTSSAEKIAPLITGSSATTTNSTARRSFRQPFITMPPKALLANSTRSILEKAATPASSLSKTHLEQIPSRIGC